MIWAGLRTIFSNDGMGFGAYAMGLPVLFDSPQPGPLVRPKNEASSDACHVVHQQQNIRSGRQPYGSHMPKRRPRASSSSIFGYNSAIPSGGPHSPGPLHDVH
jgi:hypothetical protein